LGHGGSESLDGVYSAQRHVEAIAGLLDWLGWQKVSIVGHSMGGSLALTFTLTHQQRVERLVLSATPFSPQGIRWILRGMTRPVLGPLCFALNHTALRVISVAASAFSGVMSQLAREALASAVQVRCAAACQSVRSLAKLHAQGFYQGLAALSIPTLLLYGERDDIVPPGHGEQFLALLPNARLAVLAGAGHVPMIDEFETFADTVGGFLAGEDPGVGSSGVTSAEKSGGELGE